MSIYDVEPHKQKSGSMPKRNRFYQAKIDSRNLRSGEQNFNKLPNLYIITITNYDPFGADYMMYTFRNSCLEVPELPFEDGLQFIYFNTMGTKGGSEEIGNLLHYMQNSQENFVTDDTTRELHEYVRRVRVQPEVKLEYMRFDEIIAYERQDAKKEDILELLVEYGEIPEALRAQIDAEQSLEVLKRWHKLAAKVNSVDEFLEKM